MFYKETPKNIEIEVVIISEKVEKEYSYRYIVKGKEGNYKNKKFYLYSTLELNYGNLIKVKGEYVEPLEQRNYKGFNYKEYLKTKKIYGSIFAKKVQVVKEKNINLISLYNNNAKNYIISATSKILQGEEKAILIGILIGNKDEISENTIEAFRKSNLSHVLAVSGAHASYILLGITVVVEKSKIAKNKGRVLTIIVLIIFMGITGFSASVVRAGISAIIIISSKLFYCKADIYTNMATALMIILICNPFSINDVGLQLSFSGTIGIVYFSKSIKKIINKKENKMIKATTMVCAAQLAIFPIQLLHFNTISLTFIISNLLAMPLLGGIIILGFIAVIIQIVSIKASELILIPLQIGLKGLIILTQICSKLPFSNIYIATPNVLAVIIYYISIISITCCYINKNRFFAGFLIKKIRNISYKRIIILASLICIVLEFMYVNIPKSLRIFFIDVGQRG